MPAGWSVKIHRDKRNRIIWTDELRNKVVELGNEGFSYRSIGETLGCCEDPLRLEMQKIGYVKGPPKYPNRTFGFWSDEKVAEAKRLYVDEGKSASVVAAMIGAATRSMVIGKAWRLGWNRPDAHRVTNVTRSNRAKVHTGGHLPKAERKPRNHYTRPSISRPKVERVARGPYVPKAPAKPIEVVGMDILDLRNCHCRFPLWGPDVDTDLFCGAKVARGVYCEGHAELCYSGIPEKRTARPGSYVFGRAA